VNSDFVGQLKALASMFDRRNVELARELGISKDHLSRVINGHNASDTLKALTAYVYKKYFFRDEIKLPWDERLRGKVEGYAELCGISTANFVVACLEKHSHETVAEINLKKADDVAMASAPAALEAASHDPEWRQKFSIVEPIARKPVRVRDADRNLKDKPASPKQAQGEHEK
jgi:hypothetical protein